MASVPRTRAPTPAELVERIRKDIDVAELRLQQCQRAQAEFAERSITDPSATELYAEATRSCELERSEIGRLKLALLSAQEKARAALAESQAREKAGLISRVSGKHEQLVAAATELSQYLAKADAAFRQMLKLAGEVRAAWAWQPHDLPPLLLSEPAIVAAVEHELYRIGARPALLGGQQRPGVSFPGGKSPRLELRGVPDQITPLAEMAQQASKLASEIMRTGRSTSGATIVATVVDGVPAALLKEPPPLTAQQQRLAELNGELARLANDVSAEGEKAYQACVAEIAKVQIETGAPA